MHYLLKSKIVSLFKIRNILFIFLFLYVVISTAFIKYDSKYSDETVIYGRVVDYQIKDDKVKILIKGKEKIIANYYFKDVNSVNIHYGDYIKATGKLSVPYESTTLNVFNYKKYLYNHKVYWTFNIDNYQTFKTNNILYKIKNKVYERASSLKSAKYINALLLGNKSLLDEDELNAIKNNGIMHLFAISGMHIAVLVSVIDKLLSKTNKHLKNIILIIFMALYAFIVGFPASILRVVICFIIKHCFELFKIKITNLNILFICGSLLLIYNPFYIYDLGFVYSFLLIYFLLYFNYKSKLKVCLLTFLVSAPITIYSFFHINFLSLLINIVAIPLVSFFIFPLTIITFIFPVFDNILMSIFNIFMRFNLILNDIKAFNIVIAKPPLVLIVLFYISLIIYFKKNNLKYIIIIFLLMFLNNYNNLSYIVYFLDVNQGDSSLIISPFNKSVVLVDTGGKVTFDGKKNSYFYTNNTITYLNSIGINSIDYLILSHGDYDHMGESINLVENIKVKNVIFNCGEFNDLENDLIKVLDKKKIPYYSCIKELNIDNNKLYFLQTREYDNENDNSNVIYAKINGYKFMFMGDAGIIKETDIVKNYKFYNIDVLKVGHHGSKSSSSEIFIKLMKPKYSIISVGKNNRYGHPNKEVLENLNNSKIYRTDQDGSIMFKIKNNKLKIETCSP